MRMVVNVPLGLQRACMAIALSSTIVMQPLPPAFAATPTTDCNGNTPCAERTIDFGSCGNACCAIEYSFKGSTEATTTALKKVLRDGGPDARYTLPPLEGGQAGFADLRQYGVPADFLGQVVHTTKDRNFRDTINLAVRPGVDGKGSSVRAFSSSNIVSDASRVLSRNSATLLCA